MEEAAGGTGEVNRHGYTQRTMEEIERKETGVLQLGKRGLRDMSTNSQQMELGKAGQVIISRMLGCDTIDSARA